MSVAVSLDKIAPNTIDSVTTSLEEERKQQEPPVGRGKQRTQR